MYCFCLDAVHLNAVHMNGNMTRTIKLRYEGGSGFAVLLAEHRRLQSRLIRFAYRRLVDGDLHALCLKFAARVDL
jgi:hypothetical protein